MQTTRKQRSDIAQLAMMMTVLQPPLDDEIKAFNRNLKRAKKLIQESERYIKTGEEDGKTEVLSSATDPNGVNPQKREDSANSGNDKQATQ